MLLSPKASSREDVVIIFKNETPIAWYSNLVKPSNCYSNDPPPSTLGPFSVQRFDLTRRLNKQDKLLSYVLVLYKFYIKLQYNKTTPACEPEVDKRCTQEPLNRSITENDVPLTAQLFSIVIVCAGGSDAKTSSDWLIHPVVTISLTTMGKALYDQALAESQLAVESVLNTWTRNLDEPPVGAGFADQAANPRQIEKFYLSEAPRVRDGSETKPVPICSRINDRSSEIVQYLWDLPLYVLYYSLAQAMGQSIPRSFLPCIENEDWRLRLASKRLSIYGRIVNNTKYTLSLDRIADLSDCSLIGWPSQQISPMSFTEFGVGTSKFNVRGISCTFAYIVIGRDGCPDNDRLNLTAKLSAAQPSPKAKGLGTNLDYPENLYPLQIHISCFASISLSTPLFAHKHVLSQILDCIPSTLPVSKCPRLPSCGRPNFSEQIALWRKQVVVAPTVTTPQTAEAGLTRQVSTLSETSKQQGAHREPSTPNLTSFISKKLLSDYALQERLEFAISKEDEQATDTHDPEPNVIALANGMWWTDIQTTMCSAKRFTLPPLKQLLIDSRISGIAQSTGEYRTALLRYKIGCEVFSRLLDSHDWASISFNTSLPDGIVGEDSSVRSAALLATELVSLDCLIPREHVGRLTEWIKKLIRGKIGGASFQEQYRKHYIRSEDELNAKTAHAVLFTISKLLHDYIMHLHQDEEQLIASDVQSVLDYVYQHWETEFSNVFPETQQLFQPIKDLSSFWLTQDYSGISQTLIGLALSSATRIASRLGRPDAVENLKSVIDDPVNRGFAWLTITTNAAA